MKIYRNSLEIHDIDIDKKTELKQSFQAEDLIISNFTINEKIDLQIGDYVIWNNCEYTILEEPNVKKSATEFTYSVQFKSSLYKLKNILVILDNNSEFYLFGNAKTLISLIITNLNRVYGGYYADYIEDTDEINFSFNNLNCLSAIQNIASTLTCEFKIEGKKITFKKKIGNETGLVFKYHKELRDIERKLITNNELVTKLYPYGSSRNITNEYGGKRLKISPITNNVNVFGTIEKVVNFDDIYPRFKGVVSSTPSINTFIDTGIDFNINNQLTQGLTAKVTFNTGDLAGREFEIGSYSDVNKTVELISYADDTGLVLPDEILKPRVGDKYIFWDIKMPETYIDNAENELLIKAQEYIDKYSQPNVTYSVTPHFPALRKSNITLKIGDIIKVQDSDFNIDIDVRILSLTQKIVNEFEYVLTIGNQITLNYLTQVIDDTRKIKNEIYLNKITQNELYNRLFYNLKNLKTAVYVNRGEFNPENYYYNNQYRRDYVFKYNIDGIKNWYYYIGEDHVKAEWIQNDWQLIGDNFEILATETILADNANIGDWIIQNGLIISQNGYNDKPRVKLDGKNGIITLTSPVNAYTEGWGEKEYEQTLELNSLLGDLRAHRQGDSQQLSATAYLNSDGMFANSAGTSALPSSTGIQAKGAIVGLGNAKMTKRYSGDFIAGVIGRASNSASNPAPSFGGAFWNLKSFGRCVNVKRLSSSTTTYTITSYDELLSCYNHNRCDVYLPNKTDEGRKLLIKRINGEVVVHGKLLIHKEITSKSINDGDMLNLIWDGSYWLLNIIFR